MDISGVLPLGAMPPTIPDEYMQGYIDALGIRQERFMEAITELKTAEKDYKAAFNRVCAQIYLFSAIAHSKLIELLKTMELPQVVPCLAELILDESKSPPKAPELAEECGEVVDEYYRKAKLYLSTMVNVNGYFRRLVELCNNKVLGLVSREDLPRDVAEQVKQLFLDALSFMVDSFNDVVEILKHPLTMVVEAQKRIVLGRCSLANIRSLYVRHMDDEFLDALRRGLRPLAEYWARIAGMAAQGR